jgi:hypothetical protein
VTITDEELNRMADACKAESLGNCLAVTEALSAEVRRLRVTLAAKQSIIDHTTIPRDEVAAEERDACAQLAQTYRDEAVDQWTEGDDELRNDLADRIAAAIRARGKQPETDRPGPL